MRSASLVIESWICVNLEQIIVEEEEMYPDRCEKSADGGESGLCWFDTRGLLREIRGFDGLVQR